MSQKMTKNKYIKMIVIKEDYTSINFVSFIIKRTTL